MSLNEILQPLPKVWSNVSFNSINVDSGGIITGGNITVENDGPTISIIDNAVNTNRATLQLQGGLGLAFAKVQQDSTGNMVLEDFQTNANISLIPHGSGHVQLKGPSYPAGPFVLGLDASNNIIEVSQTQSFTPTLQFGGASTGITYSLQTAEFTLIGNVLFFAINLVLSSKGSATGGATISGLPLVIANNVSAFPMYTVNVTTSANATLYANGSSISTNTLILFAVQTSVPSSVQLTDTNFANNSAIILQGLYFIS